MYNPYLQNQFYPQYQQLQNLQQFMPQQGQTILPQQQVVQAAGKASIDALQMAPNSSILIMDSTAPIVWLCTSDGLGKVNATAYDITLHQDEPLIDTNDLEKRVSNIERIVSELKERDHAKSDAGDRKPKQDGGDIREYGANKTGLEQLSSYEQSTGNAR